MITSFKTLEKTILVFLLLLSFTSCKSSKHVSDNSKKIELTSTTISTNRVANAIISNAKTYKGVRYKFGGVSKKGMDCSGLIYKSFKDENIELPRMSIDMAKKGVSIKLNEVVKGDLLFFKTNKNKNEINHVGLVTNATYGNITFIHATTGKGVITSSFNEQYWQKAFIEARRIL